jgi:hypothetical protein
MRTRSFVRAGAGMLALAALAAVALWVPIPRLGDAGINRIVAETRQRLPGWSIVETTDTWEGGYAVVASCGTRVIGFQVVPGHGLPPDDAWLQPNDGYASGRLAQVTDYPAFLIWRARPVLPRTLSCEEELARPLTPPTTSAIGSRAASAAQVDQGLFDARERRRVD